MIARLTHKIRRKARWININHNSSYKNSYSLSESCIDEKYAAYYRKKYQSFLDHLPTYKNTHQHSNKVWWCWLQGEEKAPELCKACLASVRQNLKDREVIIITEDNYANYITIPDFVLDKLNRGTISRTAFSDILRLELLIKFGGTWIDSSVLVTGFNSHFFDQDLFVFKRLLAESNATAASSWFMTSEIDNPILHTTRDLMYEYLRENDEFDRYFQLHIFFAIAAEKYKAEWKKIPMYPNALPHILQFEINNDYGTERFDEICRLCCIQKLTQKADFSHGSEKSFYHYIINHYLGKK